MHGTIFFHLQRFAEKTLGVNGWTALFEEAAIPMRAYSPATAHADEDIIALVKAASTLTGLNAQDVLAAFGEYLAPELLLLYPHLVQPNWRTLDVVSNTEQAIHTVVRARNPDATPPVLRAQRVSPDQAHLVYASPRQMCALAKGIVRGIAAHFDEQIEIVEDACMLDGDPFCSIALTTASASDTRATSIEDTVVPQRSESVWDAPTRPRRAATTGGALESIGDYRVIRLLGKGGMGEVYLAEDAQLGRKVAVKILPRRLADEQMRDRFVREARSMAAIEHEHVVAIYHVGESDGMPFFVMPRLKGTNLADWLEEGNQPTVRQALRIARQTLLGLRAAHESGLLHRDIKPANIWLEAPKGNVKLMDFGLSRDAGGTSELTTEGCVIGTPMYMPPETLSGEFDVRGDLFSFGVVLYEMLTTIRPFEGHSYQEVCMKLSAHEPPSPNQLVAEIPSALGELTMQLIAKQPSSRPADAGSVVQQLEACLALA